MSRINKVVLVGHCGADSWSLQNMVQSTLGKEVAITSADDAAAMEAVATSEHLWLVNRSLGWGYDYAAGVELIRAFAGRADGPVLMLISNYADAQKQAVEAGAVRGFGKDHLHMPSAAAALREAALQDEAE